MVPHTDRGVRWLGFEGFEVAVPNIEVVTANERFDLHNSASLRGIEFVQEEAEVVCRWRVTAAGVPFDCDERPRSIALAFGGVSRAEAQGNLLVEPDDGLDYIEYIEESVGGWIKLQFTNGSSVSFFCRTCRLRQVGLGP
ncbi:hypothetical protein [Gaopeijia maritima]|uniref:Uncharacterized protein n=1 Tax=Gaopeijia maritima TaxID=3119007 RepID=A0ABU9EBC6_9BACT